MTKGSKRAPRGRAPQGEEVLAPLPAEVTHLHRLQNLLGNAAFSRYVAEHSADVKAAAASRRPVSVESGRRGGTALAPDGASGAPHVNGLQPDGGRPVAAVQRQPAPVGADPQERLSPPAKQRWEKLYQEAWKLRLELAQAPTPDRFKWASELDLILARIGEADSEEAISQARAWFEALNKKIYDETIPRAQEWLDVKARYEVERDRLMDEASRASLRALEHLDREYEGVRKRIESVGLDLVVIDDYTPLKYMLDNDKHLWFGELLAARERLEELEELLDVVADIRSEGKDEDKIVPGWQERVWEEKDRLDRLAKDAPDSNYASAFTRLAEEVVAKRDRALEARPPHVTWLEKGFRFVKGIISGLIGPFIEAGKQVVDLAQIGAHFVTAGWYEPKFVSDLAEAAKQGKGTSEILKDMALGVVETPKRWLEAVETGDWEGIGRETANLYMLVKSGAQGAGKARQMISWAKARRAAKAGLEGGVGAEAALQALKVAKEKGVIIRVRPVEDIAIQLRAAGHSPKPEFIKMKSINKIDTLIGADPSELGMVGYFKPKLPAKFELLSPKTKEIILKRYNARQAEFAGLADEVAQLEASGKIGRSGNTITDPRNGKAFTSDYDLFEIRKPGGGEGSFEDVQQLTRGPFAAQHGPHLEWHDIPAGKAKIFADIVLETRPGTKGAKKLVEFHPDGRIRYAYFTD